MIPNRLVNYGKHLPIAVASQVMTGFPARGMKVIGVTGTDGKTTTVNMIYRILKDAGKKVAMVSTVGAEINGQSYGLGFHVTSPSARDLVRYIKLARKSHTEYLVLEVSSHALDQFRVWGIKFDIGVVTNITQEHLDYHKTWEEYFLAKSKLVKNTRIAVLNRDEKHFSRLSKIANGKVVSFGNSGMADFSIKKFPLTIKMLGEFNLLNAEAAAAATANLGVSREAIRKSLANFGDVNGRMNMVPNLKGIKIVIDYAHTPNGLKNALTALRKEFKKAKIVAVIGAEGERDASKRAPMGSIAVELANFVVITAVDPRGRLEKINAEILAGAKKAGGIEGKNVFVVSDRREAIRMAVEDLAKRGDVVGLFGKGHELSMNLDGKREVAWSDRQVVQELLAKND